MRQQTVLTAVVILLVASASAFAEKGKEKEDPNIRSVRGTVMDERDTPVEGAVVKLKNTKSLQIRSFITQQDGSYYFHGLSTNVDYELKAELRGKSSPVRTLSLFDSRKNSILNLKLEPNN